MDKRFTVGIIGLGRMAQAAAFYLKKSRRVRSVIFVDADRDARNADLLVGALAGEIGPRCLSLAVAYRKNLIDLSDVDPPGYLKKLSAINSSGITVIPGCGFSPGLTNFILGKELEALKNVTTVEIKAGSLSPTQQYYPFLWCFEDIVVEHTIPSYQLQGGVKKKYPAFDGYQPEEFFGIKAESYLCASGFENILDKAEVRNCFCRVVRPRGFREFFGFIKNYGLLDKAEIFKTKTMLERRKEDNYTLAQINFMKGKNTVSWQMHTFSRKDERLNSMQKITASVPVVMAEMLFSGAIKAKGLLFMEDLAKDRRIFDALIAGVENKGIAIKRVCR